MNLLKDKIQAYIDDIQATQIEKFQDRAADVELFRVKYLGKKGIIADLFEQFKNVPNEEKKDLGKALNMLKVTAMNKIEEFKAFVEEHQDQATTGDLTMPTDFAQLGSRHVLSVVMNEITEIFSHIGFSVAESVEIEDDWHLFSALNFPPDHPARDMQDTFFVDPYVVGAGEGDGEQQAAYPHHSPRACVPQRGHQRPRPLYLPSGGGTVCG